MLYIVDASVVAEFLITGPHTPNAQAFFKGALTGDLFTVPELCLSECANVIWQAVRFRGMPPPQALQALRDLKALPLKRAPTNAVLGTALGHWTETQSGNIRLAVHRTGAAEQECFCDAGWQAEQCGCRRGCGRHSHHEF